MKPLNKNGRITEIPSVQLDMQQVILTDGGNSLTKKRKNVDQDSSTVQKQKRKQKDASQEIEESQNIENEESKVGLIEQREQKKKKYQEDLLNKAFATADGIEEFEKEKEKLTQDSKPKEAEIVPGWGSWAGIVS